MTDEIDDFSRIRLGDRPLLVCDVDEVVLEFLAPFMRFLAGREHELRPDSFRLEGNVYSLASGAVVSREIIDQFTEAFFAEQDNWQTMVETAAKTLEDLSRGADIVFLTAMPPRHQAVRRRLLDGFGMTYPMIASQKAKGPMLKALHRNRPLPVAFVDDIFKNLQSVREHQPEALLVNLMSHKGFRALAPDPGDGIAIAENWPHADRLIRAHFGLPAGIA